MACLPPAGTPRQLPGKVPPGLLADLAVGLGKVVLCPGDEPCHKTHEERLLKGVACMWGGVT